MGIEWVVSSREKVQGPFIGWGGLRAERTHIFGGLDFFKRCIS